MSTKTKRRLKDFAIWALIIGAMTVPIELTRLVAALVPSLPGLVPITFLGTFAAFSWVIAQGDRRDR